MLPGLTYLFSVLANFLIIPICDWDDKWGSVFNNGSLPIIAFGIISAGIPYLMEKIENQSRRKGNKIDKNDIDELHIIRRRIMSLATIFLFLTSGLFILQSILPNIQTRNNFFIDFISFTLAIIFSWFSVSIGVKMYLVQGAFIVKADFKETIDNTRSSLNNTDNEFNS